MFLTVFFVLTTVYLSTYSYLGILNDRIIFSFYLQRLKRFVQEFDPAVFGTVANLIKSLHFRILKGYLFIPYTQQT